MNKIGLVISREYFSRVKKKSFLITTIGVPLIILLFYAIILYVAITGSKGNQKVAIIDDAGLFTKPPVSNSASVQYNLIKNETEASFLPKYKSEGFDAFLYIPPMSIDTPMNLTIHSKNTISFNTSMKIEALIDKTIEQRRLESMGVDPDIFNKVRSDVSVTNSIESKDGAKKSSAGVAYAIAYISGILIYMMMMIYGTMVMRGVMEEKTNRIAEVIVSSVKPFQLMMGKILGIGAVGLTQFAVWVILFLLMQMAVPFIFPEAMTQLQQTTQQAQSEVNNSTMVNIIQGLSALPLLKIFLLFIFYFIGGYLTYASLFAAIGSVVSDDQNEAQQLVFPVMMPIILGFVMLSTSINDPNSAIAVFGSIFPLTSPIVMMGRIPFDIPEWQILISMILLIGCFLFLTWLTAKIYRTGILMYGKKPSWKEMFKWAFRKP